MAQCQKYSDTMWVPWFNDNEWKTVYNLIYQAPHSGLNKQKALHILRAWKRRMPQLPSGVEGTLIILNSLQHNADSLSEESLCTLYGTSIMRFLNLCGSNERQGTFYRTAKKNKIPDWLIDLRHEIAHDQTLPAKTMLEKGLHVCFNWLRREYWEKEMSSHDRPREEQEIESKSESIRSYFSLYSNVVVIGYMQNDGIDKFETVRRKLEQYRSAKIDTIEDAENFLFLKIKRTLLKYPDKSMAMHFADILTTFGSLLELPTLTQSSVRIWNPMFKLFLQTNLLVPLIRSLFDSADTEDAACSWLDEIFKSLVKSQMNDVDADGHIIFNTAKYDNGLRDMQSLLHDVINYVNKTGRLTLLRHYLKLCDYREDYQKLIEQHVRDVRRKVQEGENKNEDFVSNDICLLLSDTLSNKNAQVQVMSIIDEESNRTIKTLTPEVKSQRWMLVQDTSKFHGCPLGILPHQHRDINPLLDTYLR